MLVAYHRKRGHSRTRGCGRVLARNRDLDRTADLLAGAALGTAVRDYLLVGSTRLWCLLAFLEQRFVTESARHQVWVGNE
jgi:hypothetical protein